MAERQTIPVADAAVMLGLSKPSLYRAIDRGEIPGGHRIGRRAIIVRTPFLRWLDTGSATPVPVTDTRALRIV